MKFAPKIEALVTSNLPTDDTAFWDNEVSYAKREMVQHNNYIYSSLSDDNSGVEPGTNAIMWSEESPTNNTAMFDPFIDTVSWHTEDIEIILETSDCDVVALFGLVAKSVKIEVIDTKDNSLFYVEEQSLEYPNITDWYEWTYSINKYKKDIFFEIPMLYDEKIKVTIQTLDNTVKVAHFTYGRTQDLGCTQWGATASRRSNVKKERRENGHVHLTQDISWKRTTVPVKAPVQMVDEIIDRLDEINGIPTLFIGDESGIFNSLLVFGFYRDFDIPITVSATDYTLEIEGV